MQKKRILFILGSMSRGGAERVISILSDAYARRGWDVDIICLLSGRVEYDLHAHVRVLDFSGKTESRWARFPGWLKNIRQYIKNERPDVVVSFAARINIITQLAALGLGTRLIVSERNDPKQDGRSMLIRLATRLLYPNAAGVVFQTKRAQSYFPYLKNACLIANPISVRAKASDVPTKKIVSVGRLTKQKNQKMLIEAFAAIASDYPEYKLEIYGEGELRSALQVQIEQLALQDRIRLPGNVLNIHERIQDAALFVLSSNYEVLSNALLEAMMMGLPCVSTNCAGSDEYIRHEQNGVLVPVGDRQALSEAISRMLQDRSYAQRMGACAHEDSLVFAQDTVIKQWFKAIEL